MDQHQHCELSDKESASSSTAFAYVHQQVAREMVDFYKALKMPVPSSTPTDSSKASDRQAAAT